MKTKLLYILIIAFSMAKAQEIPNLTFNQIFNYPEGVQDGSTGSALSPDLMLWSDYTQQYRISYVAVTSSNTINIASSEAVLFKIYVPPYVSDVSISFNGSVPATQFCRVASIELATSEPTPTSYIEGTIADSDWKWKGVGDRTFNINRNSSFFSTGSYIYYAFYNGANVDDNYDNVPDGDLQYTYDLGSFNVAWGINQTDSTDYYNWANGITNINSFNSEKVNIYPNPAKSYIVIENTKIKSESLQILDITGKTIYQTISNKAKQTINIDKLKSGIYFIRIGSTIQKFIKE